MADVKEALSKLRAAVDYLEECISEEEVAEGESDETIEKMVEKSPLENSKKKKVKGMFREEY